MRPIVPPLLLRVSALLWCTSFVAAADDLDAARALYEQGKLEPAQQAFEKLAAADAKPAEVNFYLGEIALRRNEPEKAAAHFERAVAAAPSVSRYHHRLGDAYGRWAQKASIIRALSLAGKCRSAYERAVALDPANLDARYSLFVFYRQAPAIIGGGTDKAAAEAAAIGKIDADRGRIASAALHVTKKNYHAARAELAEIRPTELATVTSPRFFLSDATWSAAKVGWGEPARNHAWFNEESHQGVVLIVHGRLYAKGLYAHSPSRYTFTLDRQWKEFTATIGLREGAQAQGSAIFTVRGDGRELFRSRTIRVDESDTVKLDITGIQELELVTEPGGAHNHFSWAIWVEPLVQR